MKIRTILIFYVLAFSAFYSGDVLSHGNNDTSKSLFESKCSRCHGLERISQAVKTPVQWGLTVNRMREKDIEWISDEKAQTIAAYLALHSAIENSYQDNHSDPLNIPPGLPKLFGLITFCLLLITLIIGFVMTHGKRRLFKIHKIIAYITLASGVIHGVLIFITH
ncbi:MAG: hypothetical protein JW896_14265 [Deltaproteobacteria bacterium]|nr:hypothetical protein [Deltaproteobacteria bacterium]